MSDNRTVKATAVIENGRWTLKKGSILGLAEDQGITQKARNVRATMPIDQAGKLLEDVELGNCSPSFAGCIVLNQSNNGWTDWKNTEGQAVDVYRQNNASE